MHVYEELKSLGLLSERLWRYCIRADTALDGEVKCWVTSVLLKELV